MKSYDAYKQFPEVVERLRAVNARLSASTSAAVALIFKGRNLNSEDWGWWIALNQFLLSYR